MAPCCRRWTIAALVLAAAGAVVFLAGVGASHTACWNADLDISDRLALFASGGLTANLSCAYSHGWSWLVVFFNIGAVTLAGLSLLCSKLAGARMGALALVTLACSYMAPLCDGWLAMKYVVPADHAQTARAVSTTVAGLIIACASNLLLCFALGWRHEDKAVTTTCCQKAQKPAEAPTAVTADAAFTAKQAAAMASQV